MDATIVIDADDPVAWRISTYFVNDRNYLAVFSWIYCSGWYEDVAEIRLPTSLLIFHPW
jgi:hypothetical protein